VGKTTCAAAAALEAASRGRDVLVVSTDPAHSLGDALDAPVGPRPRSVRVPRGRLTAVEVDAPAAFARFLARRRDWLATIVERGTYLDREDVDRFVRLSLPGVDELVSLIEIERLAHGGLHDEVIVDTAPTGHTLRLLAMPALLARVADVLDDLQEKHRFLALSLGGAYRADDGDALVGELQGEAAGLAALLRDGERTALVWVTLPEMLAVKETVDGVRALEAAGLAPRTLIVNRRTPAPRGRCALCEGRRRAEAAAIAALERALPQLERREIPALEREPRGPKALRTVKAVPSPAQRERVRVSETRAGKAARSRSKGASVAPPDWLPLLLPKDPRLVLFAGKGGVGKTTCAATTALALTSARPAGRCLLLSADPAHSVADVLERPVGDEASAIAPSLDAREIDAARALAERRERYREAVSDVFAAVGRKGGVSATFDRRAVEDLIDLAPPGIDELFAVLGVVDALLPDDGPPTYRTALVDTAPTGHALRLLAMPDLALEWVQAILAVLLKYRDVVRLGALAEELVRLSRSLKRLHALLRDPAQAAIVVVTRPADLPRLETARLLAELKRRRMPVSAVIVNAATPPGCPRCRRTAAVERREIHALRRAVPRSKAVLEAPAVAPPPTGTEALSRWGRTWKRIEAAG
jgi:arsenite-transporting ATPase